MQYGTHYSLRAQMSGKEIDSIPTEEEGKRENLLQVEKKDEEIEKHTALRNEYWWKRNEHYDYEIFKAIFQPAASNNKCAAQFIIVVGNVNKAFSKRKQTNTPYTYNILRSTISTNNNTVPQQHVPIEKCMLPNCATMGENSVWNPPAGNVC